MCTTSLKTAGAAVDSSHNQTQTEPVPPATSSSIPETAMASNAGINQSGSNSGPSVPAEASSSSNAQPLSNNFGQPLNSSLNTFGQPPHTSTAGTFGVAAQPPTSSSNESNRSSFGIASNGPSGFALPSSAHAYNPTRIPYGSLYNTGRVSYAPPCGSPMGFSYRPNSYWSCCVPGCHCASDNYLPYTYGLRQYQPCGYPYDSIYGNQTSASGFGLPPIAPLRSPSYSYPTGTAGTQPYISTFGSSRPGPGSFGSYSGSYFGNSSAKPTGTTASVAPGSANSGTLGSSTFANTRENRCPNVAGNGQSGSSMTSSTSASGGTLGSQASFSGGLRNATSNTSNSAGIFGASPFFGSDIYSGWRQQAADSFANSSSIGPFGSSTTFNNNTGNSFGSKPFVYTGTATSTGGNGGLFGRSGSGLSFDGVPFTAPTTSGNNGASAAPGLPSFGPSLNELFKAEFGDSRSFNRKIDSGERVVASSLSVGNARSEPSLNELYKAQFGNFRSDSREAQCGSPVGSTAGIGNSFQPSHLPVAEAVTVDGRCVPDEDDIYGGLSFEESRLADYGQNRKGSSSFSPPPRRPVLTEWIWAFPAPVNTQKARDDPVENFRSICVANEFKSPEELKLEFYSTNGLWAEQRAEQRAAVDKEKTFNSALSTSADGEAKPESAGMSNKERMKQLRSLLRQISLGDNATESGDTVRSVRGSRKESGDELFRKLMVKKQRHFVLSGFPAGLVEADLRAYVESLGVEVYRVEILPGDASETVPETVVAVIVAAEKCQEIMMNGENWPENVVVTME